MTWLVWRQYRLQAAIAAAMLAAFAAVMIVSGARMASQWHAMLGLCGASGGTNTCGDAPLGGALGHDLDVLSIMVPAILGIFWGAPLVAHEIESGTSDFAWTQSVTRTRWLTVKAGWLLLAAAVWGGAVAALVTWWSGPRNALYGNAFEPNYFDLQGIVPIGYAVFATALGIAVGTLLRRTLPAIAVVLGGFIGLRLLIDWVRPHYMAAVTTYYSVAGNFTVPTGSWELTSGMVDKAGRVLPGQLSRTMVDGVPVSALPASCRKLFPAGGPSSPPAGTRIPVHDPMHPLLSCLQSDGYRQFAAYQPADRYWAFQGIETGIFVALAAALLAVTFLVVSRRDA